MQELEQESIRLAMDQAWRDHHHARDQTWKAVQIEAVLAAGIVGVDFQLGNVGATIAAGVLVIIAAIFGITRQVVRRCYVAARKIFQQ